MITRVLFAALLLSVALQAQEEVRPRSPWQEVNTIIAWASEGCRLDDRAHSSVGLMRCMIEKMQASIDGDQLRPPEAPTGGRYETPPKYLPEENP